MKFTRVRRNVTRLLERIQNQKIAEKHFKGRQEAIKQLMQVDAFMNLVEYFEFEADSTMERLGNEKLPVEEIRYLQGRHSVVKEFLDYIYGMSK